MAIQERWRIDTKLTAMMVEDFIHDPILASKVILRLRIPPHQQIRIMWMWVTYYTQDDSGFSTGKSFTHAIIAALRSVLFPDRVGGIISGTFRQGKLIFSNFDKWYNNAPIFRNCIKHFRGQPRLTHGTELWEAHFRGGSSCRVLPPNFIQNSERLRSERWHDGYFDEWPTFGIMSLTKTLFGRVTAVNEYQDDPIRQNHIHLAGTPGFKHDAAYPLVKKNQEQIAAGNRDYGQFTCNYRHVPKTDEWRGFVDRKTIFNMEKMNPPGIVRSEVDGIWQEDSLSFYLSKDVNEARFENCPTLMTRQYESDIYVGGFDSARGGSDGQSGKGDDFSFTVLKISDSHQFPQHVHTTRLNNVSADQMAGVVQKLHKAFHFACIGYDPGGGGLFVRDELRKYELPIDGSITSVVPIVEITDSTGVIGDTILVPFRRGFIYVDLMWGKMASDSVLVNRLHRQVTETIRAKEILLAPKWHGWDHIGGDWDVDAKREWLNKAQGVSNVDRLKAEMDLAIGQLIKVDVARNKETNLPITDRYGMFKFTSNLKKDSAYGFIYSFFAHLIFRKFGDVFDSGEGGELKGYIATSAM